MNTTAGNGNSPATAPPWMATARATATDDEAAPAEAEVVFEQAIMLWYSASMFIVSGLLFVSAAVAKWRNVLTPYVQRALDVSAWASLYFAFAITLVVYNKWLISVWEGGFRFPLVISLVHMSLKLLMSWTVVRGCRARDEIPRVSRWTYYVFACPVGVTTGLDVAASNGSLFYVSITLYTVIKSTSIVFVLFYSALYRLQPCSLHLVLITGVICSGVLMASYGDTVFDAIGFTLVFVASALGGYRWALTEILMHRIGTKMNSLMTIYTISPASVLILLPFAMWLEMGDLMASKFYQDPGLFLLAILNVCGSGVFAFAMIYAELAVLNRTSSLSLVVIGYFKQCTQIIVSVIVFHEILSPLNIAGVVITFAGMAAYAYVKKRTVTTNAQPDEETTGGWVQRRRQRKHAHGIRLEGDDRLEASAPLAGRREGGGEEEEEEESGENALFRKAEADDSRAPNLRRSTVNHEEVIRMDELSEPRPVKSSFAQYEMVPMNDGSAGAIGGR